MVFEKSKKHESVANVRYLIADSYHNTVVQSIHVYARTNYLKLK